MTTSEKEMDALRSQVNDLHQRQRALLTQFEYEQHNFVSLARAVWQVQEDERRRLAGDLHDGVGQNLTALKHQLALIGSGCGDDPGMRARVETCLALCSDTLEQTRRISRLLRPQILDDLGLVPALEWLARNLGEPAGVDIEVAISGGFDHPLDQGINTLLFRIAQEALSNVVRHASAQHAIVRLDSRNGELLMEVWDDGRGFDVAAATDRASASNSLGLSNMRQRLQMYGGRLEITHAADSGTRIRCHVPLMPAGTDT